MKILHVVTLAAGFAIAPVPGAAVRAESGSHADSPLSLTDIIARPRYVDLKISPDGRYFAGTALTGEGQSVLHILDRKSMSVVHSEVYGGPLGIGAFDWHDNDHLLITSTWTSELAEDAAAPASFS
jgi:hypothetical protein